MIENKTNILKTFEGQKIDQSVHVARWATTVNNQDSSQNIFMKYAAGSSNTIPQNNSQIIRNENMFQTQQSQVHQIDTGFKKLKNNQIQMLKQLKQQYQVLRTLNIQSQLSKPNNIHSQSSSSIRHVNDESQILSSSSHHSKKKKISINNMNSNNNNREIQILALEKKQLQMVINNSMRKIQELLHSEMEYKKQIHELKIQVSGRQNTDIEYESMLKTLKKNQINSHQTIESLKRQNDKFRNQLKQLNQKISSLEGEIVVKEQQIRRIYDDKRKTEDLIRIQKDRYFNLDIDYKKTKMEYELMEKDKNSQINRLNKQLDYKDVNKVRQLQSLLKRYEDDNQVKDKRYNLLLTQLEDVKRKNIQLEKQLTNLRNIQQGHVLDKEHIEQLLTNYRDHSDSTSFNHNINEVLDKLHQLDKNQNDLLRQEIQDLKDVIESLKDINSPQQQNHQQNINYELYERKIEEIQKNLRYEINQKDNSNSELRRIKIQNQDLQRRVSQYQVRIQEYQSLQTKMREQLRTVKTRSASIRMGQPVVTPVIKTNNQLFNSKRLNDLEEELKMQKRRADENQFQVTKANTQLTYKLKMQQNQYKITLSRMNQDLERINRENQRLKEEYEKYRVIVERKLEEREKELQALRYQIRNTTDHTQGNLNNIKLEYQTLLKNERQRYRVDIEKLTNQITSLTKINQRYMLQTNKYIQYENELISLREIMRSSIHLSQGVDHLWRVKETEYQNVNEVLRKISSTWQY